MNVIDVLIIDCRRKQNSTLKDSTTTDFDILLQIMPDTEIWPKVYSLLEYVTTRSWILVIVSGFEKMSFEIDYCY